MASLPQPGRRSSGNVFRDLGFPPGEAARLEIRSDLMIQLAKALSRRRLSGSAAATRLGVTHSRVRALSKGRIEIFTVDELVGMLARLGLRVGVVVTPLK